MVPDIILGVLIYLTDTLIERRKEINRETLWASLVAHTVKTLPAVWETCVRSLGQKDSLEEGMVTYSSILAWRILWIEEPGGLYIVHGVVKSQTQLKQLTLCSKGG